MKQKIIAAVLCIVGVLLFFQKGQAMTLTQGTVSLSGSSNIVFNYSNPDDSSSRQSYSLSARPGYFVKDNLELATQLSGSIYDSSTVSGTAYAITPLIIYHMPLNETSAVFGGLGAGYSWSRTSFDPTVTTLGGVNKSRGSQYGGLVGWEYFISSHLSLNVNVDIKRQTYHDYHNRFTIITTQLGFSIYL